jgi:hypothetical protein
MKYLVTDKNDKYLITSNKYLLNDLRDNHITDSTMSMIEERSSIEYRKLMSQKIDWSSLSETPDSLRPYDVQKISDDFWKDFGKPVKVYKYDYSQIFKDKFVSKLLPIIVVRLCWNTV